MRPSPSALFVVAAVALATGVGFAARSASGSETTREEGIPADAARLGFFPSLRLPAAANVSGVALLDATQPFRIELSHGPVSGSPAAPERLLRAQVIVARELARYPRTLLRAIRMRGIVFADDLMEGETSIPSLPNVGGLLLLDVNGTDADLTRGLHHEVYHFADLADDGSVSPDPAFDALNTKGFAYGAGGRSLRSSWAALRPEGIDGFVSVYAMSGVEEDKAETFAFAMARPAQTREQAEREPILAAKLDEIAGRLGKLDPEAPRLLGPVRRP